MIYIDLLVLLALVSLLSIWLDRRYVRNRKARQAFSRTDSRAERIFVEEDE